LLQTGWPSPLLALHLWGFFIYDSALFYDQISRFTAGSISSYFDSASFKVWWNKKKKAQVSGVLGLFYFSEFSDHHQ